MSHISGYESDFMDYDTQIIDTDMMSLNEFKDMCIHQAYIKYFSSWQHAFIHKKIPAALHVYLKYCATVGHKDSRFLFTKYCCMCLNLEFLKV